MRGIAIVILAVLATAYATDKYTTENDNLDIEAVVSDDQKLLAFCNCFTDKGECDAVTGDFKKDLPEAIEQACVKCTDAQKHIFKVFLDGLKKKLPAEYDVFVKKYDSENKYFPALIAAVASY